MTPVSSKKLFDIQGNIECGFTLNRVHDMIKTYNQLHPTDKYSQLMMILGQEGMFGYGLK